MNIAISVAMIMDLNTIKYKAKCPNILPMPGVGSANPVAEHRLSYTKKNNING